MKAMIDMPDNLYLDDANEDPTVAPAWFGAARKYALRVTHHDMAAVRRNIALGRAQDCHGGKSKDFAREPRERNAKAD